MMIALTMSLVSGSMRVPIRRLTHRYCSSKSPYSYTALSSSGLGATDIHSWSILCETPEDIEAFGSRVASVVGNTDIILLKGDLGAGKTTFTRGLIRAKFEDDDMRVTSPSYLLDNVYEYDEAQYIHHMDLYRLPTGCDLSILGIPEIYDTSLCIIEWPQRMGTNLPVEYLDVNIEIEKDEARNIKLVAVGAKWISKLKILMN